MFFVDKETRMETRKFIVYCRTAPNGKRYIGITCKTMESRGAHGHGYSYNGYFANAIKKHGWNNFKHEVLARNLSEQQAKKLETFFILKYKSNQREFGYNRTNGGDGNIPNAETRKLISLHHADVTGDKNPFKGKKHTTETKLQIAENHDYTKQTGIGNIKSKITLCFETLQLFGSSLLAHKILLPHIGHNVVNSVCRQLTKPIHGYHFMYYTDFITLYHENPQKILEYINTKHKIITHIQYNKKLPFSEVEDYYNYFTTQYNNNNIINSRIEL